MSKKEIVEKEIIRHLKLCNRLSYVLGSVHKSKNRNGKIEAFQQLAMTKKLMPTGYQPAHLIVAAVGWLVGLEHLPTINGK